MLLILSSTVTNKMPSNVTNTVSTNFNNKNVRYKMYCYILHTVLLKNHITVYNHYHYAKHRPKHKILLLC